MKYKSLLVIDNKIDPINKKIFYTEQPSVCVQKILKVVEKPFNYLSKIPDIFPEIMT